MNKETYEKTTVREELHSGISLYDLDGDIDTTIEYLLGLKDKHKEKGYCDLSLEIDCDPDGNSSMRLYGSRPETDKEFEKRISLESAYKEHKKKVRQKKEEDDYQNYLKLKKKFEKGDK